MENSILKTVKQAIGPSATYSFFEPDIIMHVNTTFMILTQMGVGPAEGFSITDESATWSDFISDINKMEGVKTYVCQKARLFFDPPTSSILMEALKQSITELEWRLNWQSESTTKNE